MVTRNDVAREAGTSSAVVSYVVNNGPRPVAEATRARVLDAVQKLGYRPNAFARSLRSSTSTVLGLVVSDIRSPYCAELASAIEDSALAAGHTLLLASTTGDDERLARHLETFIEHRARGIIFVGSSDGDDALAEEAKRVMDRGAPPLVFLDRSMRSVGVAVISVDNRAGAAAATSHLLDHGYGEVANFAGVAGSSAVRDRTAGWSDALRKAGLDPAAQMAYTSKFDRYDAFARTQSILASGRVPRAIFSHSDEQSIGIMHAVAHSGMNIPHDIALASFDDIREASIVTPGLTSVAQPFAQLGELAVQTLLTCDVDAESAIENSQLLPVELVIRQSCGCP